MGLAKVLLALAVFAGSALGAGSDPGVFRDEIQPFLAKHCVSCHNAMKAKGGVDFSKLGDASTVRRQRKLSRKVVGQVASLEMPPEGEPEVPPERRERVVGWLKGAVVWFDCDDPSSLDPGHGPRFVCSRCSLVRGRSAELGP